MSLGSGEMLNIPRGAPHRFTCRRQKPGGLLTISTPVGIFEAFIADVCTSIMDSVTPTGGPAHEMPAIGARHGIEFLWGGGAKGSRSTSGAGQSAVRARR
jgi:hypothetical protein